MASASNAPMWTDALLGVLLCCCVTLYLIGYIYFAVKNPDALRSERFTLSKMAIEKNLIGDNIFGLLEVEEAENLGKTAALPKLMKGSS